MKFFLILLLLLPARAHSFDFLKSCDERFESAWSQCLKENKFCDRLPKKLIPDCQPKDSDLYYYPGGEQGRNKKVDSYYKKRKQRISKVSVTASRWYQVDDYIRVATSVDNLGTSILEEVILSCTIDINKNRRIFAGKAFVYASLLPGATDEILLHFNTDVFDNSQKVRLFEEDTFLDVGSAIVRNVSVNCKVENVFFEDTNEWCLNGPESIVDRYCRKPVVDFSY